MNRPAIILLAMLAAGLGACGNPRGGENELMRRVAQAEAAADRAEAAARRAEAASAGPAPSVAPAEETIYEPAPDVDPEFGKGSEPVPVG